jgi:hypothetical protein
MDSDSEYVIDEIEVEEEEDPAIVLTITPDDLRNFQAVLYSLSPHKVTAFGEVDTKTFLETDI